ncbi:MAG TPA: peptidase [Rhabdaerophilum sp.]|nr:peptidase [Rhabdaerophilum sp.]
MLVPSREPGTLRRVDVVCAARSWIGTPYQHQASLRGEGCDCLGLLRGIWRDLVGPEPERMTAYAPSWAEIEGRERLLDAATRHLVRGYGEMIQPGNILIFRWKDNAPAKHCGIATGVARFIHAHDGASVAEVALVPSWRRRIVARFDFPSLED